MYLYMTFFREAIEFMEVLGVYDVVLPFLLIFTIMYAILERTKLFKSPIESDGGGEVTPSNLHAMVAFSTALIAVASTQIISTINLMLSYFVLITILIIMFLMLVANFRTGDELKKGEILSEGWRKFFVFLIFFGIVLIFLYSMGWYDSLVNFFVNLPSGTAREIVYSFVILALMIAAIYFIVRSDES